jgi:putative heme transporter
MATPALHSGTQAGDRRRPAPRSWLVQVAVLGSCLGLASWYFLDATSWGEIRGVIEGLSSVTLAAILVLALVNLGSYWLVLAASVPGLGLRRSAAVHLPATALSNTLPAGGVLGTGLMVQRLRSWDFSKVSIGSALVINGLLGTVAKLSVGMAALLALTPAGDSDVRVMALVATITSVLVAGTVAALRSQGAPLAVGRGLDGLLSRARRTFSRLPPVNLSNAALRFQATTRGLIRDRWAMLVGASVVSHASHFALFVVCFRAAGMSPDQITTVELLVAFGLTRIITVIALTPGSIGLVEVSLAATFTAMGEPPHEAIAGVLLFRSASYLLPTLGGLLVLAGGFLTSRRGSPAHPESGRIRTAPPSTRPHVTTDASTAQAVAPEAEPPPDDTARCRADAPEAAGGTPASAALAGQGTRRTP